MKSNKHKNFIFLFILSVLPCNAESNDPPLPSWAKRAILETKFSFLKTAKPLEFSDFGYFDEPKSAETQMPEKVQVEIQKEAGKDFKELIQYNFNRFNSYIESGEQAIPDPLKIYSTPCVFKGPENILVYALHVNGWGSVGDSIGNSYCFILYDSKRDLVAQEPIWISTRWGDIGSDRPDLLPTVVKPLISFEDISGNGNQVFVVEDILHNGTFNAVLYHYYAILPDFKLTNILDLETRSTTPGFWWEKGYEQLNRKIIARQKNQITIGITLEGLKKPPVQVGSMILKRTGPLSHFKIDQKLPKMKTKEFDNSYYLGTTFFDN